MKVTSFFNVGLTEGSPELVQALLKIHPGGKCFTKPLRDSGRPPSEYFRCELPEGDPTLNKLIQAIKDHGYRLWAGRSNPTPQDILFQYRRKYETLDWENVELLQPQPNINMYVGTVDRNPEGLLVLDPAHNFVKMQRNGLKGFEIGFTVVMNLVVSEALRAKFEVSDLKQLLFKPILSKHNPVQGPIPGCWELTSDYVMPSLANPKLFEGFYTPVEYHYRASDLKAASPFDFGRCLENRNPIVSKRFYQFCVEQNLDMTWEPVRIDED